MSSIRILLDHFAEPSELEAVREVAEEAGLQAEVEGGYRKPTPGEAWGEADEPEWIVMIITCGLRRTGVGMRGGTRVRRGAAAKSGDRTQGRGGGVRDCRR